MLALERERVPRAEAFDDRQRLVQQPGTGDGIGFSLGGEIGDGAGIAGGEDDAVVHGTILTSSDLRPNPAPSPAAEVIANFRAN